MSSHEPLVSIVLPVYNHANYISRAIQSVLEQDVQDIQLIIVDDGSTDDIAAIVSSFEDSRIIFLRHNINKGAAAARNSGIEKACGKYIAFLDADDYWDKAKLRMQLDVLSSASYNVKASTTYFALKGLDGSVEHRSVRTPYLEQSDIVFGCSCSPGSTLIVERDCFVEIGPFDTELQRFEDWDWLLRYTRQYKLVTIASEMSVVRQSRIPDFNSTVLSIDKIAGRHLTHPSISSAKLRIRLYSSLLIEKAAAYYRVGAIPAAIKYVAFSFIIYPFRNTLFFRRMFSIVRGVFFRLFIVY